MILEYLLFSALVAFLAVLAKGQKKEYFCEIILKLSNWPKRKCCLKIFFFFFFFSFLALAAILFNMVETF